MEQGKEKPVFLTCQDRLRNGIAVLHGVIVS